MSKAKCLMCGTILESKTRHDFVQCKCPNRSYLDGGNDYYRVGGFDLSQIILIKEDGTDFPKKNHVRKNIKECYNYIKNFITENRTEFDTVFYENLNEILKKQKYSLYLLTFIVSKPNDIILRSNLDDIIKSSFKIDEKNLFRITKQVKRFLKVLVHSLRMNHEHDQRLTLNYVTPKVQAIVKKDFTYLMEEFIKDMLKNNINIPNIYNEYLLFMLEKTNQNDMD